jgi:hypothetical protein
MSNSIKKLLLNIMIYLCTSHVYAASTGWRPINVIDPMGNIRSVICEYLKDYAIIEDDILVKEYDINSSYQPHAAILQKLGGGRWIEGRIPFMFNPDLPEQTKQSILLAMQIWEMHTKIQFIEINPKINLETDYVIFYPDNHQRCSSYVGRQGGAQSVRLAKRCSTMNIVHELGHTIGLWHEQSRLDRDAYVRILWENISEEHWYNFNQHITDGRDYDEYDYQSIMHYSAYAFSKNNQKTIVPIQKDVEIGQRQFLSSKDIAAVNAMSTD